MSEYKITLTDEEMKIIKLCLEKAADEMPPSQVKIANTAYKLLDKLNKIPF